MSAECDDEDMWERLHADRLIAGEPVPDDGGLGEVVALLHARVEAPAPEPTPALAAVLREGLPLSTRTAAATLDRRSSPRGRLAQLAAVSLAAKLVMGTGVATAAVTGLAMADAVPEPVDRAVSELVATLTSPFVPGPSGRPEVPPVAPASPAVPPVPPAVPLVPPTAPPTPTAAPPADVDRQPPAPVPPVVPAPPGPRVPQAPPPGPTQSGGAGEERPGSEREPTSRPAEPGPATGERPPPSKQPSVSEPPSDAPAERPAPADETARPSGQGSPATRPDGAQAPSASDTSSRASASPAGPSVPEQDLSRTP